MDPNQQEQLPPELTKFLTQILGELRKMSGTGQGRSGAGGKEKDPAPGPTEEAGADQKGSADRAGDRFGALYIAQQVVAAVPGAIGGQFAPTETKTKREKALDLEEAAAGVGSTAAGAVGGAVLGSAVPVVGTVVGAGIGATIGSAVGPLIAALNATERAFIGAQKQSTASMSDLAAKGVEFSFEAIDRQITRGEDRHYRKTSFDRIVSAMSDARNERREGLFEYLDDAGMIRPGEGGDANGIQLPMSELLRRMATLQAHQEGLEERGARD